MTDWWLIDDSLIEWLFDDSLIEWLIDDTFIAWLIDGRLDEWLIGHTFHEQLNIDCMTDGLSSERVCEQTGKRASAWISLMSLGRLNDAGK